MRVRREDLRSVASSRSMARASGANEAGEEGRGVEVAWVEWEDLVDLMERASSCKSERGRAVLDDADRGKRNEKLLPNDPDPRFLLVPNLATSASSSRSNALCNANVCTISSVTESTLLLGSPSLGTLSSLDLAAAARICAGDCCWGSSCLDETPPCSRMISSMVLILVGCEGKTGSEMGGGVNSTGRRASLVSEEGTGGGGDDSRGRGGVEGRRVEAAVEPYRRGGRAAEKREVEGAGAVLNVGAGASGGDDTVPFKVNEATGRAVADARRGVVGGKGTAETAGPDVAFDDSPPSTVGVGGDAHPHEVAPFIVGGGGSIAPCARMMSSILGALGNLPCSPTAVATSGLNVALASRSIPGAIIRWPAVGPAFMLANDPSEASVLALNSRSRSRASSSPFFAAAPKLVPLFLRRPRLPILSTKASTPPTCPITSPLARGGGATYVPDRSSNSNLVSPGPAKRSSAGRSDGAPSSSETILPNEDLLTDVERKLEALSNVRILLPPVEEPGREGKTVLIGLVTPPRDERERRELGRSGRSCESNNASRASSKSSTLVWWVGLGPEWEDEEKVEDECERGGGGKVCGAEDWEEED